MLLIAFIICDMADSLNFATVVAAREVEKQSWHVKKSCLANSLDSIFLHATSLKEYHVVTLLLYTFQKISQALFSIIL